MRFLVSPDRQRAVWRHKLDDVRGTEYADWIDCTRMGDEEFEKYIKE